MQYFYYFPPRNVPRNFSLGGDHLHFAEKMVMALKSSWLYRIQRLMICLLDFVITNINRKNLTQRITLQYTPSHSHKGYRGLAMDGTYILTEIYNTYQTKRNEHKRMREKTTSKSKQANKT